MRHLAGVSLLQRDLHVVAEIGAPLASAATAAPAAHAEQVVENIGESGGEFGAEPGRAAAAALFECGMAEAVIGGALVGVLEDLVGLVDFLETVLGILVAGIAIRMALHRLLAEGGLDVDFGRAALDRKSFIVARLAIIPHPMTSNHVPPPAAATLRTPGSSRGCRYQ